MSRRSKLLLVLGGYVLALVSAAAVVHAWQLRTSGPDAQAMSGMYAFGDLLWFVGVFCAVGSVPTALALYFLRPFPVFWRALATVSGIVAATSLMAAATYAMGRSAEYARYVGEWPSFAVLRLLAAPIFGGAFVLGGLFAPSRGPRLALLAAGTVESGVALCVAFYWMVPHIHA